MLTDEDWDRFIQDIRVQLHNTWLIHGNHHVSVMVPQEDIEKLKKCFTEEDWYWIDLVVMPRL